MSISDDEDIDLGEESEQVTEDSGEEEANDIDQAIEKEKAIQEDISLLRDISSYCERTKKRMLERLQLEYEIEMLKKGVGVASTSSSSEKKLKADTVTVEMDHEDDTSAGVGGEGEDDDFAYDNRASSRRFNNLSNQQRELMLERAINMLGKAGAPNNHAGPPPPSAWGRNR